MYRGAWPLYCGAPIQWRLRVTCDTRNSGKLCAAMTRSKRGSHARVKPTSIKRVSTKRAGIDSRTGNFKSHTPTDATRAEVLGYAKRGATIEEIAVILDLRPGTVNRDYGPMINRELALHTLEVEEATLLSAKGRFSHPDTHVAVSLPHGSRTPIVTKVPLVKHYPPNVAAQQFWLKNRQPAHRAPGAWEDHSDSSKTTDPDEGAAMIRERLRDMRRAGGVTR